MFRIVLKTGPSSFIIHNSNVYLLLFLIEMDKKTEEFYQRLKKNWSIPPFGLLSICLNLLFRPIRQNDGY